MQRMHVVWGVVGSVWLWPASLWAQGALENPEAQSFQSGIGVISGFECDADRIDLVVDDAAVLRTLSGMDRPDTRAVCGDADNGFALLVN
jgi:hypothetical protein